MYRQYKLEFGNYVKICWLRDDDRIQVNSRLTIKKSNIVWTCVERYETLVKDPPIKDWKVGGIK